MSLLLHTIHKNTNPFRVHAKNKNQAEQAEAAPVEGASVAETAEETQDTLDLDKQLGIDGDALRKVQTDQMEKRIDVLPKDKAVEIVRQFAVKSNTSMPLASTGIACLCQGGGTNASNPNKKITVEGVTFELRVLREVINFVTPGGTVRQLAKTLRDQIAKIAIVNDWPGPLAVALVKEFPDKEFNSTDLVYAAEFHDDNRNPEFPKNVAEALAIREARLKAERRNKPSTTKSSNKKKKGGKGKKGK